MDELITFAILAGIFFALVLGIPYAYRLLTRPALAPGLHPGTAITGTWTGVLEAPPIDGRVARDPYGSEQFYQLALQDTARQQRERIHKTRAVYLDLGLDPFHLGTPRLRGKVRMCAYNGALADFDFTTLSMDDGGAVLILRTDKSDEFGNLTLKLADTRLQARYDIVGSPIQGALSRGGLHEFEQACGQVSTEAARALDRQNTPTRP